MEFTAVERVMLLPDRNTLFVAVSEIDYQQFQRGHGWIAWPKGLTEWGGYRVKSIRFAGYHPSMYARIFEIRYEREV